MDMGYVEIINKPNLMNYILFKNSEYCIYRNIALLPILKFNLEIILINSNDINMYILAYILLISNLCCIIR